jgi:PAS domain S-box-containing protein
MHSGDDGDRLPKAVVRFMANMERVSGRMPVSKTVFLIVMVGSILTAGVMAAVWWFEQSRTHADRQDAVERLQALVQDRINFRVAMVDHVAALASERAPQGEVEVAGSWSTSGIVVVPNLAPTVQQLGLIAGVDAPVAKALLRCLEAQRQGQAVGLCRPPAMGAETTWYLVDAIHAPGHGWVLMPLDDVEVGASAQRGQGATLRATMFSQPPLGAASAAQWTQTARVQVADTALQLTVIGEEGEQPWTVVLARQAGLWVAAGAGLVFTLASLHGYLLLISTRRRAKDIATDMATALHRTQSRNQAVMDTAPDAIIMSDEQGRIQWCNQATTSIFGRPSEELMNQPLSTVLPALGGLSLDDWFSQHGFSNRVIGYETTGLRNEGIAFPVAISASRTALEGEAIQTFIVRDTTDAKWAEQELSLRDRALASSADGVLISSMLLPNQPIIYVNQAFEQITGYAAHEVLGMNCKLLQRDDIDQPGIHAMRKAIQAGEGCKVVVRNYHKDGSLFYNDLAISPVLNAEGVVTHYVGVQNDITDRIAAEKVLQLRTERLNAVFDLSPDGFVVLDKRGEISIVNPAFERMTDLMASDLVGQSLPAFEEQLMARCKSREVEETRGEAVLNDAGEPLPVVKRELLHLHTPCARTLVRRVRDDGQDNETVMYFRDITHEREVDRMKSEFLAMAAHELRTPMVSIFGFTELLLKRPFTDERRNDVLSTIHRQAGILINLVNELLDLARIESRRGKDFKRERHGLQPLVRQVIEGVLMQQDSRKVDVTLPEAEIFLDVDREKFSLALTNVVSNAYKYSPKGGEIQLDLVSRDRDGQSECGVRVTDHGMGMTPEQVSRVFERFFRADTSGNIPGTGLGMTIVKEIIELHGGQVSLVSEFGVGTTVTLWLPVKTPLTATPDSEGVTADTEVSTG